MEKHGSFQITGKVTARTCPLCGHHEIGITNDDGEFYPLKTGTRIQILDNAGPLTESASSPDQPIGGLIMGGEEPETTGIPWTPEPVLGHPVLRRLYGVFLKDSSESPTGSLYRTAYLEKLSHLVEKEVMVPVPVLLDRYFTAPNLASGDAPAIALNLMENLDEIREPAQRVMDWLDNPAEETLALLTAGKAESAEPLEPASPSLLKKELEELCLEDFFRLLAVLNS